MLAAVLLCLMATAGTALAGPAGPEAAPAGAAAWRWGRPQGSPGDYEHRLSVAYRPEELAELRLQPGGGPRVVRIVEHTLAVSTAARAQISGSTALLASLSSTLVAFDALEEGALAAGFGRGMPATDYAGAVGLEHRLAPSGSLDLLVSLVTLYPAGLRVTVGGEILRDPVVLSATLAYTRSGLGRVGYLSAALGLGLLANDRVSLAASALFTPRAIPPGTGSPAVWLEGKTGYALDPEGRQELAVRMGVRLLSGQAVPVIGLEWVSREFAAPAGEFSPPAGESAPPAN